MAKALQCPDCGTRHPLEDVGDVRTFRCRQCRRLLKVPAGVTVGGGAGTAGADVTRVEAPTAARAAARRGGGNGAERVPPSQRGDAIAEQRRRTSAVRAPARARVPRPVRLFVWLLALPVGLLPVLVVGRMAGVLTIDRAVDVFVGVGYGRFLAPLLMLPVWAATSATVAHLAIEGIARARGRSG